MGGLPKNSSQTTAYILKIGTRPLSKLWVHSSGVHIQGPADDLPNIQTSGGESPIVAG
jgi:hypothetical protein